MVGRAVLHLAPKVGGTVVKPSYLGVAMVLALHAAWALGAPTAAAPAAEPATLSICYMDFDKPPYWSVSGAGQDLDLVRSISAKLGLKLSLTALPWKRCQLAVDMHNMDGMLGASFAADRLGTMQYPLEANGRPDDTAALHMDGYSFYKKKRDPVHFDGNQLQELSGAVGTNAGFSIVEKLGKRGIQVTDSAKSTLQTLEMLLADRYQVVVDSEIRADYALRSHPELQALIERMEPPVERGGRFLVVSRTYYNQHRALIEKFWQEVRNSHAHH